MEKLQVVDAILDINLKTRQIEEGLSLYLEQFNPSMNLEKITDEALLKEYPISSLDGVDSILHRLSLIETMVNSLINDKVNENALGMLQYLKAVGKIK